MNWKKILQESLKVLILASVLSSVGGFSVEVIKEKISVALPLIIILPAFANMVGVTGIITVSKLTTYFNIKKSHSNKLWSKYVLNLFFVLLLIFVFSALYVTFLSLLAGYLKGFSFDLDFVLKMILIVLLTTLIIFLIVFVVSLVGSRYAYKRKIDPDDLMIPIATSIADLGGLIVFSILVFLIL